MAQRQKKEIGAHTPRPRATAFIHHLPILHDIQWQSSLNGHHQQVFVFCGKSQWIEKKSQVIVEICVQVPRKTSPESDLPRVSLNTPRLPEFCLASSLVVVKLEVEAPARLEGVKVEGPGLLSSATALLVFGVQRILTGVKFLPHFWKDNNTT